MGDAFKERVRVGKVSVMFFCPVPSAFCTGRKAGKEPGVKCHNSVEEVRRCEKNYLEKLGYKRLGPREFETPQGSILILSKKPARMRPGKGTRYMSRPEKVLPW
jgi:hypothetical protein